MPLQSGWSDLCLQKLERAVTTVDVHKTLPKCQSPGDQGSLAEQLDITDPSCVKEYRVREMTRFEHATQIRDAYGFVEFTA